LLHVVSTYTDGVGLHRRMFSKGSKASAATATAAASATDGSSSSKPEQQGDTIEVQQLKEVVVIRNPPAVHVYDVVSHGRRFYRLVAITIDTMQYYTILLM
jgi:hypothetical protein